MQPISLDPRASSFARMALTLGVTVLAAQPLWAAQGQSVAASPPASLNPAPSLPDTVSPVPAVEVSTPATGTPAPSVTAAAAPVSDEIVVTGLKRSASVQAIAATVSVVSGQFITQQNLTNVMQIADVVPGVRIARSPDSSPAVTIRGIGSLPGTVTFDQTVGLYVDGVYLPRARAFNSALFDVERVEVYKGAQAAVLGKNTTVGAISVTSREPGNTFTYQVSALREFAIGQWVFNGAVDIPLAPDLAIRASGIVDRYDGWIHNLYSGKGMPRGRNIAGRAVLLWTPGDLRAKLTYQHADDRSTGAAYVWRVDVNNVVADLVRQHFGPSAVLPVGRTYDNNTDVEGGERFRSNRLTLNVEKPIGRQTLTGVANYSTYGSDQTLWGAPGYDRVHTTRNEEFFGEARVSSTTKSLFEYIVGASDLHEKLNFDVYQKAGLSLGFFPRSGELKDFAEQTTDALSPFTQVIFHPVDKISLIGSARYTHQRRSIVLQRDVYVAGSFTGTTPPFPRTRLALTDNTLDGSLTVQYMPTSGINLFAGYGKGSKGAGFITQPTNPATARFNGEKAYTWEAGGKFRGRWGHINVSVFDIKVAGFQQVVFDGTKFVTLNVPLRSRGAEGEIEFRPAAGLRLSGNAVYAHVRRTDTNTLMSYSPAFTATADANYDTPLTPGLGLTLNAGLYYRSEMQLRPQIPVNAVPASPAYTTIHARIGVKDAKDRWEVALIGQNLTNAYIISGGYPSVPASTTNVASIERPRTIALQLTLRN